MWKNRWMMFAEKMATLSRNKRKCYKSEIVTAMKNASKGLINVENSQTRLLQIFPLIVLSFSFWYYNHPYVACLDNAS